MMTLGSRVQHPAEKGMSRSHNLACMVKEATPDVYEYKLSYCTTLIREFEGAAIYQRAIEARP